MHTDKYYAYLTGALTAIINGADLDLRLQGIVKTIAQAAEIKDYFADQLDKADMRAREYAQG